MHERHNDTSQAENTTSIRQLYLPLMFPTSKIDTLRLNSKTFTQQRKYYFFLSLFSPTFSRISLCFLPVIFSIHINSYVLLCSATYIFGERERLKRNSNNAKLNCNKSSANNVTDHCIIKPWPKQMSSDVDVLHMIF
jgi:hypothetical protein